MENQWPPAPEPLDSELEIYMENLPPLGMCIRHPLVYAVPYMEPMNQFYNNSLKQKKEYVNRARRDKDWSAYLLMHERPYRLDKFEKVSDEMTDQEYWENLIWVYTDLEFHHTYRTTLKKLFTRRMYKVEWLMTPQELNVWQGLPDSFTIYRGVNNHGAFQGMSWTLSESKAEWFAKRFKEKNPMLLTGKVNKINTYAFKSTRNEKEIIVLPKFVEDIKWKKLK